MSKGATWGECMQAKVVVEYDARCHYAAACLEMDFGNVVCREMRRRKVSRAALSQLVGCAPEEVTRVLQGRNVTIKTMGRFLAALELIPRLTAVNVLRHFRRGRAK